MGLAEKLTAAAPMVQKILVCTTAHVTKEEAARLDSAGYSRGQWGWLIALTAETVPEIPKKSAGFTWVIALAMGQGCSYVLFDRDADAIAGLHVYDW